MCEIARIKSGDKFGRLTVIREDGFYTYPCGAKAVLYLCRCDCGTFKTIPSGNLRSGNTKSCGCLAKDRMTARKSRNTDSPTYAISTMDSFVPQFKTLKGGATSSQIMDLVNADSLEEALQKTFPFWWEYKARNEINNFRRMKDGYVFSANDSCDLCGQRGSTIVHHIVPLDQLGGNEIENILFVCRSCHKKAHNLLDNGMRDEYYKFCRNRQQQNNLIKNCAKDKDDQKRWSN